MRNMTLENIAKCLSKPLYGANGKEQQVIAGAVLDSRKVAEGFAFFATRGEKVDGHSFIPQVAEKKAALVICEVAPTVEIPYILVEDTFVALKEVAAFYREQLNIPFVGVTGSVGKTSTKEMIAAALGAKFNVLKTQGNFNNEVGLPLTILGIREEHEVAVVEMGISDFDEMHRLSRIAKPDVCVITNIGQCHLENLIDRDGVLKAKTEIFDFMQEDGCVVLNGDDDKLATVKAVKGKAPFFFGLQASDNKTALATDIQNHGLFGSDFKMSLFGKELEASVPLPGQHMVINALAAATVGKLLGMEEEDILKGIASVQATGGRSNIMKLADKTVIDDCYNANPVSMKAAIDLLMMAQGRKVVILGDMFELGTDELALHREVGMYAAMARLEGMIFIGNLSKEMYEGAVKLRAMPEYYTDKEAFFAAHKPEDFTDATVLVKASHGMHFEEIVEWLK
ncbi:MAG: UDP-N-acetylmuramoyl-tripeptide--D-alanyl-D-alanine ligase [Lachnospiraceae bacterium]|nr:UDP-N-acetylmuramoyl-tripeptide--D-alanyl-D-alanine ligase [Lachnospiraceae bacterium]